MEDLGLVLHMSRRERALLAECASARAVRKKSWTAKAEGKGLLLRYSVYEVGAGYGRKQGKLGQGRPFTGDEIWVMTMVSQLHLLLCKIQRNQSSIFLLSWTSQF